MTEVSVLESLRLKNIQDLFGVQGPCLTILLPPYRPGEQAKTAATLLKSGIQEAARQLGELKLPDGAIAELLAPLHELAKNPALQGGSHWGRAIFRAPGVFRQFQLTEPVQPEMTVAGCFSIRSILTEAQLPPEFYLLKVSKKRVDLLRCTDLRAEPVKLPRGVPETLEEAMAFDPPDHDLENRSPVVGSTGTMKGIRFGTGSGRETQHAHLADFYKIIDRGMHELLNGSGAGLVLVGVDEDTALYHSVSTYPDLLEKNVHGSPDGFLHEADMLRQAYAIARAAIGEREAKELEHRREHLAPTRFSTHLNAILDAAFEGRVGSFYFDRGVRNTDVRERREYRGWGREDLQNLAAVQTLLHGGEAFALTADKMPNGVPAAAVLRF